MSANLIHRISGLLLLFSFVLAANVAEAQRRTVVLETKHGQVEILLRPEIAPKHVERMMTLVRSGFYDGLPFFRVIEGFVAQTGDPTGTGRGGSDLPDLAPEFSDEPFVRGTVGMHRFHGPNTANSQFFIAYDEVYGLRGSYTVVGQVVSGMSVLDKLKKGDPATHGMVEMPDKIIKMFVEGEAD
jgi:peptidylprolyl isomerase